MFGGLDASLVIPLGLGLVIVLLCVVIGGAVLNAPMARRYKRRLKSVTARKRGIVTTAGSLETRSLSRRERSTVMDRIAKRWLPHRDLLVRRLERTGRTIGVGRYLTISLGVMAATALLSFLFLPRVGPFGALLLGLAGGAGLPHILIGRMGSKRVARFIALFPEAIDLIVRALRSGLPISEALINCSHEIGDPVGTEFGSIESGMRLGRDLESLLWEVSKRIDAPEFKFFIIALSVQRETGGNLAETLANLGDVLRRRRTMRKKARAMASEARTTASILGCLPLLVTGALMMTSPTYIMLMFMDPRGVILIGVAIGMLITGIGIMVKLARFDI
ncbi:MAG TPA: type II secretion system F family protein [Stellaceae bacterium]|jgi:tight adherence protein B|nr:type II secretion system F family protein [Stellaceae bacterium]